MLEYLTAAILELAKNENTNLKGRRNAKDLLSINVGWFLSDPPDLLPTMRGILGRHQISEDFSFFSCWRRPRVYVGGWRTCRISDVRYIDSSAIDKLIAYRHRKNTTSDTSDIKQNFDCRRRFHVFTTASEHMSESVGCQRHSTLEVMDLGRPSHVKEVIMLRGGDQSYRRVYWREDATSLRKRWPRSTTLLTSERSPLG
eukprot:Gb_28708 [translate_table: standard]